MHTTQLILYFTKTANHQQNSLPLSVEESYTQLLIRMTVLNSLANVRDFYVFVKFKELKLLENDKRNILQGDTLLYT